jgi:phage baseplate assembly protein W
VADAPHFSLPFRVTPGGAVAVSEQDSVDEIADCVVAVLSYPLGSRPELPDFGVDEQAFVQGGPDLDEIRAAIDAYEPRASVELELTDDRLLDFVAEVRVGVAGGLA